MGHRRDRRAEIIACARQLVRERGIAELTFAAVADRLGVTKQAVIYWFETKEKLLGELNLAALRDESDALVGALDGATPEEAVRVVLRNMLEHHGAARWEDLRLQYMTAQMVPATRQLIPVERREVELYPVTGRFYAAFEAALRPRLGDRARDAAAALHLASIGFATMAGLMDAIDDRMKTPIGELADLLADLVIAGLRDEEPRSS